MEKTIKTQIHTFELVAGLAYDDYHTCRDYFFKDAKGRRGWCFQSNPQRLTYTRWLERGITIFLNTNSPAVYLRMKINPSKLLGNTDALTLFDVTEASTEALVASIQAVIDSLPIDLSVASFRLSRLDLCRNLIVPNQKTIEEYLRLLERSARRKKWYASYYDDERGSHSFRRSNDRYQVTAYDKLYQIQDRGLSTEWDSSDKILRVEVSLFSVGIQHICHKFQLNTADWTTQFYDLSQLGAEITNYILSKLIFPDSYYSLDAARYLISASFRPAKAAKLIQFLIDINRSQAVDKKAIKNYPNGKHRLQQLLDCGINPVTIECRARISCLPSLFIESVSDEISAVYYSNDLK